jgi:(p)ppGpp synthase/HD superfamily hydrolase
MLTPFEIDAIDYLTDLHLIKEIEFVKDAHTNRYNEHGSPVRKNGRPYWLHCVRMVYRAHQVLNKYREHLVRTLSSAKDISNCYLKLDEILGFLFHDIFEDTFVTFDEIVQKYSQRSAEIALALTKPKKSDPKYRAAPGLAAVACYRKIGEDQLIVRFGKGADRIDNLSEMGDGDLQFQKKYLLDSSHLIPCIDAPWGMDEALKNAYWAAAKKHTEFALAQCESL